MKKHDGEKGSEGLFFEVMYGRHDDVTMAGGRGGVKG